MSAQEPVLEDPTIIAFPDEKSAVAVKADRSANPLAVLQKLGIAAPKTVILIAGGAGSMSKKDLLRLAPFFSQGIAHAVRGLQPVILDGGTQAGVMKLMGAAAADQDKPLPVIGVCPLKKVTFPGSTVEPSAKDSAPLDPNHSHFVLVDTENWGGETAMMYNLADTLRQGRLAENSEQPAQKLPVVTILAGGQVGGIAMNEVLAAVRKGWPVVVLEGSGPLPNEIAHRLRLSRVRGRANRVIGRIDQSYRRMRNSRLLEAEAKLDEIIEDGKILLFPIRKKPTDLQNLLRDLLKERPNDTILLRAWKRFALYDHNAGAHQKLYLRLRNLSINLGVLATALILLQQFLVNLNLISDGDIPFQVLRVLIILTPIVVSLCLAAERQFKSGNKWLMLRYYAEQIKKDIYSYRVLRFLQEHPSTNLPHIDSDVSTHITRISERLMRTEVNESALKPYGGQIPPVMYGAAAKDDGFGPLSVDQYIDIRINDQVNYYTLKTNRLETQLYPRQWLILVFGAFGSLLAALGGLFQFWVPLTVAIVSAISSYLDYQQMEPTIIKYNQSMTKLSNLSDTWVAKSAEEKALTQNVVNLVEEVELVMESEHFGWAQQMQAAQTAPVKPADAPKEPVPAGNGAHQHPDADGGQANETGAQDEEGEGI